MSGDGYTVMVSRRGDGSAWQEPAMDVRPRVHLCTVCGTSGVWGPAWSWFGSYKDADRNPDGLPKFCGHVCRDQWAEDNARYVAAVGAGKPKAGRVRRGS